ncbi:MULTISPECIES: hypothetical protein [Actinoalloteichus]|uniref:Uncharacterized protein n=1 Tax=Actinoalloteichus fjordicus TaxID=1612552 RepID=A0AAC9LEN6_9PSEU|nr:MULTISPECIES: hypothetical protein [Actinoalloteichus]APU15474.1 hypothetical protein UA74_17220 [Actinoalloteichus fjordicus]APU21541.1 hypothetical protein UA75_17755 [Actinoalloteichus sp. GBA129-24]
MRPACTDLIELPERADDYLPLPDPDLQAAWSAAPADVSSAAGGCLTASIDRTGRPSRRRCLR